MPFSRLNTLLLTAIVLLAGCGGMHKLHSYTLMHQSITTDSAGKLKTAIRAAPTGLFLPLRYTGSNNTTIGCRLMFPAHQAVGKAYPLVLVLHGSGAIGTDNESQLGVLAKYWAQQSVRNRYPAYVVVPQVE